MSVLHNNWGRGHGTAGFEGRLGRLGFLGRSIAWGLATTVAAGVLTVLVSIGGHAAPGLRMLFVAAIVVPVALYAGSRSRHAG